MLHILNNKEDSVFHLVKLLSSFLNSLITQILPSLVLPFIDSYVYICITCQTLFMKFSFFTAIFAGIINFLAFILFVYILTTQLFPDEQTNFDMAFAYFVVFIFGLTTLLLFISAYKIKRKMKTDVERDMQNSFLNA